MLAIVSIVVTIMIISEGKLAIAENPARFNKEASQKYKNLLPQEKERLKRDSESFMKMDVHGILRTAEKLFQKIQKLVSGVVFLVNIWPGF